MVKPADLPPAQQGGGHNQKHGAGAGILEQMGQDWHWTWIKGRVVSKMVEFSEARDSLMLKHENLTFRMKRKVCLLYALTMWFKLLFNKVLIKSLRSVYPKFFKYLEFI